MAERQWRDQLGGDNYLNAHGNENRQRAYLFARHLAQVQHQHPGNFRFQYFRLFIFVIFSLFVIIRLWMLIIETNNSTLISLCAVAMATLFLIFYFWRQHYLRNEEVNNPRNNINIIEVPRYSLADLINWHVEMNNRINVTANEHPHHTGLSQQMLEDCIPSITFTKLFVNNNIDHDSQNNSITNNSIPLTCECICCSICQEDYAEGDILSKLPMCNHIYHKQCVFQWLTHKSTCPLCNVDIKDALIAKHPNPLNNDDLQDVDNNSLV